MFTPPSAADSPVGGTGLAKIGKRRAPSESEQEKSASPDLKKGRLHNKMRRTPQPTLTQSKLTSMLQAAPPTLPPDAPVVGATPAPETRRTMTTDEVEMDTSVPAARTAPLVTEDFLLRAMKANTEEILKSFSANLGMLAQKVDGNSALIADNRAAIARQAEESACHKSDLHSLSARVADLEKVAPPPNEVMLGSTVGPRLVMST